MAVTIPSIPENNNQQQPQKATPVGTPVMGNSEPTYNAGNLSNGGAKGGRKPDYMSLRQLQQQQSILGRTPTAEVVKKFRESLNKTEIESLEKKGVYIIDLNANEHINISALIFCVVEGGANTGRVAHHTVILGSTMVVKKTQEYTYRGTPFVRVGLPTDAWDKNMQERVSEMVKARYPNHIRINAAASTLPESFDYTSESAIQLAIYNATNACKAQLWKTSPAATYLVIGQNFGGKFRTEIKTSYENQVNIYGSPVRSDIVLELYDISMEKNNNNSNNDPQNFMLNDSNNAVMISNITGFIDLMWVPNQFNPLMMQQMSAMNPMMMPEMGNYVPRFVITQIDQILGNDIVSMLFSLATIYYMAQNMPEENTLKLILRQHELGLKNTSSDGMDTRDLGALGYDANPSDVTNTLSGNKVDTRSYSAGDAALQAFIRQNIRTRSLTFAIDVEECGPNTWMQGIFYAAANPQSVAYKELINAANLLTNNNFGKHFKSNVITLDDNYRVNLGWYTDEKGVRRDIRDIDLVAMLNIYGKTNITEARDWSNHQSNNLENDYMRCAMSRDKIKSVLLKPVFEGYGRRISFDSNFLFALVQGISDAGVTYQTVMGDTNTMGGMRSFLPWLQNMSQSNIASTAFVQRNPWSGNSDNNGPVGFGVFTNNYGQKNQSSY